MIVSSRGSWIRPLAIASLLGFVATEALAQTPAAAAPGATSEAYHGWVTVGVGPATRPGHILVAANYNFGRTRLWQVGATAGGEFWGREEWAEIHVGVGRRAYTRPLLAAVFVGPSVARLVTLDGGPSDTTTRYAPGLAVDAQLIVVALPEIGLGVGAFGHLNTVRSVAGVRLMWYFGNDRW